MKMNVVILQLGGRREEKRREGKGKEGICKNASGHNTYQVNLV